MGIPESQSGIASFTYSVQASRIVFGAGTLIRLPDELPRLGCQRALVLSTPEQRSSAEQVAALLGARAVGVFDRAAMHVPIETARAACDQARALGADCAVAVGGGSTTGLGKAIALDSGLPIIAIPTTYAGSEVTPIYGLTEAGVKKTGKDPRVLPRTVIYDPELSMALPVPLSITSGMNAIAHAAEGLYAQDSNPVMSLMAEEGIRALAQALPCIAGGADLHAARSQALYGAWLCGTVLGNVGMALHHKLCHTLGGSFNLPHAEVHTVVLPHALAFNAAAAPTAMARIGRALGLTSHEVSAARALFDLAHRLGAPTSLAAIGLGREDIARAAQLAVANPYWNPRPVNAEALPAITALLQAAFEGSPPGAG
jgi:maleylacetate reductase